MVVRRLLGLVVAVSMALAASIAPPIAGPAEAATSPLATPIAAGASHGCAVSQDGSVGIVRCWGSGARGQLGDGTLAGSATPVAVLNELGTAPLAGVRSLAAGTDFSCALLIAGTVLCWGAGNSGQLGDGSAGDHALPVAVFGITTAVEIVAGAAHACARLANGTVRCWGANASGQLGDGTKTKRPKPVAAKGLTGAKTIAAGDAHTCAVTGSASVVRCWGANASGQLGDGTKTARTVPITVKAISKVTRVTAGSAHTCARLSSGGVRCWGANAAGQLGDGTTTRRLTPVAAKGLAGVTSIAAGASHTCGRLSSGVVRCWGANSSGQLGDGTLVRRLTSRAAQGTADVAAIAAGGSSSCAYRDASTIWCWGGNIRGQIGDGTTIRRLAATAVVGLLPVSVSLVASPATLPNDGASITHLNAVVRDAAGFAVVGARVSFIVIGGWTAPTPSSRITVRDGLVTTALTSTTIAGSYRVLAALDGAGAYGATFIKVAAATTLSVTAAPGGVVSPAGTSSHTFGSMVGMSVTPADPNTIPGMTVDGAPVALTAPTTPGAAWTIDITMGEDHQVAVTYGTRTPQTVVLDSASGALFAGVGTGGSWIRFNGHTPVLDSIVVGGILAAGVDCGVEPFLLKVTGVASAGSGLQFATEPAGLADAIDTASVAVSTPVLEVLPAAAAAASAPLRPTPLIPASEANVARIGPLSAATAKVSVPLASWTASVTSSSGPVTAEAMVQLDAPVVDLALTVTHDVFPNCPNAALVCGHVTDFSAGLSERAKASVTLTAGASYSKEWEQVLASHAFNSVVVIAGIPVPLTLTLEAGVGAKVDFKATISTSAVMTGSIAAGAKWTEAGGWAAYNTVSGGFTYQSPILSGSATVRGYPFFQATPALGFNYGGSLKLFCGPYVRIEPGYLELTADISNDPWWSLDAGVRISGGARCSFGDPWEAASVNVATQNIAHASGGHRAIAIAAGQDLSCAIVTGGSVECWGRDVLGLPVNSVPRDATTPSAVLGLSDAVKIAAGAGEVCIINGSGEVWCWSPGGDAPAMIGLDGYAASQIALSTDHGCAIVAGGYVRCWGSNYSGELGDGTTTDSITTPTWVYGISSATTISASAGQSCATLATGYVRCWGANNIGQLGIGTEDSDAHPYPTTVYGISTAVQVSAGSAVGSFGPMESPSCALLAGGSVRCWGSTGYDVSPDPAYQDYPVTVPGISGATAISAGDGHLCALASAGSVQCVGDNWSGQLGDGSRDGRSWGAAMSGVSGATAVAAGGGHTCVIVAGGSVRCTGDSYYGQVGDGRVGFHYGAVAVADLSGIKSVGAGGSCAIDASGGVWCWGGNFSGQLGDGTTSDRERPVAVIGITGAKAVAAGSSHACALLPTGRVWCWGSNSGGQLGNNSLADSHNPVLVTGITTATAIAAGGDTSCARLSNGTVRCWGRGPLGNGSASDSRIPVPVYGITTATQVAVAWDVGCARLSNATVRCWGENSSAELGDGTLLTRLRPVTVTGLLAVQITPGCALRSNGTVACWGSDFMGLMGGASCPIVDNGVLNVPICKTPKTVPGLSGVKEIAMDGSRACVRLATGQVKCWGYRGDWRDSSWEWINRAQLDQTPVTIPGVSTAVGVASGDDHACALLADTTLRCWGNGHSGQLGNGVFGYSTIAVPVAGF